MANYKAMLNFGILVDMRFLAVGLFCIACLSISAQDQPDNRVHYACTSVTPLKLLACQTNLGPEAGRRLLSGDPQYRSAEDFARNARVGDPWPGKSNYVVVVTFAASDIQQDSKVFRLQGKAEIHTAAQVVEADDAVYHSDTGEIEAHGNVLVKPAAVIQ
jgi:lipopolysaccharide assembly outer membrane protein LptD (OstA)